MMNGLKRQNPLDPTGAPVALPDLILGTLAINILSLALPVMTLQLYDRILPNPESGTLPVLLAGVCIAMILETVLRLIRGRMLLWAGAAWEHTTSCDAMDHYIHADLSLAMHDGVGIQLGRMASIGKLKDFYNGTVATILCEIAFVPLFLGLAIYIAGPLAVVPVVVLMVFTVLSLAKGQALRRSLCIRDDADDKRYDFLIEALGGVHTLKALGAEKFFSRRYEGMEEASTRAHYNVSMSTAALFNMGTVFSHIMVASVITAGALLVLHGQITSGALVATVLLSGRMMQPLQRGMVLWARFQDYKLSREKAESLFDMPLSMPMPAPGEPVLKDGRLKIRDLGLSQADGSGWIIETANLDLKHGDALILQGGRGAGKTAFLEMIAGIYPASCGEISIDGRNVQHFKPETLIEHVAYIPTEGIIFRGTVRDNLTAFGQLSEDRVREVAGLLGVDRDIARLPAGFDTLLTGTGVDMVPPGLRQRIAIVRALAPKPRLVLFDNADRGLDREGYNLIYRLLARLKGKATMILISEDRNIRSLGNRVARFEHGALIETAMADARWSAFGELPAVGAA